MPEDVIRDYVDKLEDAVVAVREELGLVDVSLAMNNDIHDEHETDHERWGEHLDCVQKASKTQSAIFDSV